MIQTTDKLKKGYVREDGFIFVCYQKNRIGIPQAKFLSPEAFERFKEAQKRCSDNRKEINSIAAAKRWASISGTAVAIEKARINNSLPTARERKRKYKLSDKGRTNAREYAFSTYRADPNTRNRNLLRNRLRQAVLRGGKRRAAAIRELTGCPLPELVGMLTRQMAQGRTLRDYDIDHIIPCSFFDLTKPDEVRACFHFSNLQLLTQEENAKKGDSLPVWLDAALELSYA